jgi:MFS transporter, ACS family, D-galactonate transporter
MSTTESPFLADTGQRPTRVRYAMLALLFVVTALNYLDRTNLSVAAPHIKEEFDLSPSELGLLFSVFSWTYVLLQVPGGWLLDRLGGKVSYGLALIGWSACTVAMAFTRGLGSLIGVRLALGVTEAPTFPANNKFVASWFPSAERGRATSAYSCGQYLGLAIALPLLTWIIAVAGWRNMFLITGVAGFAVAVVWFKVAYNRPSDHPKVNAAELALTAEAVQGNASQPRTKVTWRDLRYLLSQRRLWGMYLGNFCANSVMWFFLTWFPSYLNEEKGISFLKAGFIGTIPYIAALIGVFVSGFLSDYLLRRNFGRTWARKAPLVAGFLLTSVIVLANYTTTPALVITVMSVAFFGQGFSALGWTICSEVAPLRSLGLAGGVFNFFTNLGGATSPLVIGIIVDRTGSFSAAISFIGALGAVGLLSYLLLIDKVDRLPGVVDRPAPARI